MEIKQYKVEKGIAIPVNPYPQQDISQHPCVTMLNDQHVQFWRIYKDLSYYCNAPDGVYDADRFEQPVWQYKSQRDKKWYDIPKEWIYTHRPIEKHISSWYDETRQFLHFKPWPENKQEFGEYNPITCNHRKKNGLTGYTLLSHSSGSGPDIQHEKNVQICLLCGTIRISGRELINGQFHRYNEEVSIDLPEAVSAIVKNCNFMNAETEGYIPFVQS